MSGGGRSAATADPADLFDAALRGDDARLGELLLGGLVSATATQANGRTALHHAAGLGHARSVRVILSARPRPRVDCPDGAGFTPLHLAVCSQHVDVCGQRVGAVQALLDAGASPNVQGLYGDTAVHLAAAGPSPAVLRAVLAAGGDPRCLNGAGQTPICIAVSHGHAGTVQVLVDVLDAAELDAANALHLAVKLESVEIVEALLARGVNVNTNEDDENGATPLHIAARLKRRDLVSLLLDAGAEVDALDGAGNTPLHHAVVLVSKESISIARHRRANYDAEAEREAMTDALLLTGADPRLAASGFARYRARVLFVVPERLCWAMMARRAAHGGVAGGDGLSKFLPPHLVEGVGRWL